MLEEYDNLNTKTAKTIRFILRNKWECPLCQKMTSISRTECDNCKKDLGYSKFKFESRLREIIPDELYDFPWYGGAR